MNRLFVFLMLCITLLITSCNITDSNPGLSDEQCGGTSDNNICKASANLKCALFRSNNIDVNEGLVELFYRYYTERHKDKGPFHNHELEFLSSFRPGDIPSWNQLTRFIALVTPMDAWQLLINENDFERYLPTNTFDEMVQCYFSSFDYEHRDSEYLRLVNEAYIPTGWSFDDVTYYRLTQISQNPDGSFNASLDGFVFWPPEFYSAHPDLLDSVSDNMRALIDYAGIGTASSFDDIVLEIFLRDDYEDILTVDETVEISFFLSDDPEYAFRYVSNQRLPEISDPF